MTGRPVAFLDRDGVLNEFVADLDTGLLDSPLRAEDVRLVPGAAAAAARLAAAGFALVCITNQPAAAHGRASIDRLLEVHRRVEQLLAQEAGVTLHASRLCWHHPEGVVKELSFRCGCRKPAAGMLLDAARTIAIDYAASWMVGDTDTDVVAGQAVGCRTLLIEYEDTAHKRSAHVSPDLRAGDLGAGVELLLGSMDKRHFQATSLC